MNVSKILFILFLSAALLSPYQQTNAAQIRVAVASNFSPAIKALVEDFEGLTEHSVTLIFGSTGKHYAQIINGAPYDAFFAADAKRPELLELENKAIINSRFTYALGKIILWSPQEGYIDSLATVLAEADFRFLAIANPRLAPYGKAAQETLITMGLWDNISSRLVRGENIAQTFQFVSTGNAQLGFVALSQVSQYGQLIAGSYWLVPQASYQPIEQQALLLRDNDASRQFMAFVQSPKGQAIIRNFGYDTP